VDKKPTKKFLKIAAVILALLLALGVGMIFLDWLSIEVLILPFLVLCFLGVCIYQTCDLCGGFMSMRKTGKSRKGGTEVQSECTACGYRKWESEDTASA